MSAPGVKKIKSKTKKVKKVVAKVGGLEETKGESTDVENTIMIVTTTVSRSEEYGFTCDRDNDVELSITINDWDSVTSGDVIKAALKALKKKDVVKKGAIPFKVAKATDCVIFCPNNNPEGGGLTSITLSKYEKIRKQKVNLTDFSKEQPEVLAIALMNPTGPVKPFAKKFGATGMGLQLCTIRKGGTMKEGLRLGPDGEQWVVYETKAAVESLAQEAKELFKTDEYVMIGMDGFRHLCKENRREAVDHMCCKFGGWAFQVVDGSVEPGIHNPPAVIFLHIMPGNTSQRKPGGEMMVPAPEKGKQKRDRAYFFYPDTLVTAFEAAIKGKVVAPRVWRRTKRNEFGMEDEIAVNFCIKPDKWADML